MILFKGKNFKFNRPAVFASILLCCIFVSSKSFADLDGAADGEEDEFITDGYTALQRDAEGDKFLQLIEKNDHKFCLLKYPGIINYDKRDITSYWRCRKNITSQRLKAGNFADYNPALIKSYINEFESLAS